jgi:hypothetical protein
MVLTVALTPEQFDLARAARGNALGQSDPDDGVPDGWMFFDRTGLAAG